jgi:hypothetical protein
MLKKKSIFMQKFIFTYLNIIPSSYKSTFNPHKQIGIYGHPGLDPFIAAIAGNQYSAIRTREVGSPCE